MSESLNIFLLVLESFVTLLVVFGNSLVLASVIRNKKLRTISNKLIFSLSVANILAGLGTLTMDIILDCDLIQSKVFCSISFGFYQYAVTITIHHLCIISIDKYLAIVHALRYTIIVQEQRLKYILIGCWAPGIPICFFPILVGGYYDSKSAGFSRNCIFAYNGLWLLLDILIFWIPCVIIIFTYTMIFRAVRHQVRSINRQSNSRSSSDSSKPSYRKPFITLGLISGSFLICWTPTFLLEILQTVIYHRTNISVNWVHETFHWIGFSSYALNPCIYAFRNQTFRKEAVNFICKIFCCRNFVRTSLQNEVRKSWMIENASRPSYRPTF